MSWVAGADGCRGGWLEIRLDLVSDRLEYRLHQTAATLLGTDAERRVLAIDIPMGLSDGRPRACDLAARRELGARWMCVFHAPVRPALGARSYQEASAVSRRASGRRITRQAWGIFAKVREVDAILSRSPDLQASVREVHPELSWAEMRRGSPIPDGKRSPAGRAERRRLVAGWLGGLEGILGEVRAHHPRRVVADDDVLDAFACLWTAERIARGAARTLPSEPARDARGLRMEIAC
jgi:predicted RNase H-like nuclease